MVIGWCILHCTTFVLLLLQRTKMNKMMYQGRAICVFPEDFAWHSVSGHGNCNMKIVFEGSFIYTIYYVYIWKYCMQGFPYLGVAQSLLLLLLQYVCCAHFQVLWAIALQYQPFALSWFWWWDGLQGCQRLHHFSYQRKYFCQLHGISHIHIGWEIVLPFSSTTSILPDS